jgi:hypothetical protein
MIVYILLIFLFQIRLNEAFTKVLVPAVFKEWLNGEPKWMSKETQELYNFSTFKYQKINPDLPNYIKFNRGINLLT